MKESCPQNVCPLGHRKLKYLFLNVVEFKKSLENSFVLTNSRVVQQETRFFYDLTLEGKKKMST